MVDLSRSHCGEWDLNIYLSELIIISQSLLFIPLSVVIYVSWYSDLALFPFLRDRSDVRQGSA